MQRVSRRLLFLVLGGALFAAGGAGMAQSDQRADRRTAERLAALLPAPPEGWSAARTEKVWRRGGARVRRIYRGPDRQSVRIVMETRTRGVMYKYDLLSDAERARQYGYSLIRLTGGAADGAAADAGGSTDGEPAEAQPRGGDAAADSRTETVQTADAADTNPAGGVDALLKSVGSETEIRFWLNDRILVLVVGQASRADLEALIAGLDFRRLATVN